MYRDPAKYLLSNPPLTSGEDYPDNSSVDDPSSVEDDEVQAAAAGNCGEGNDGPYH